jgi:hypothetical protein
MCGMRRGLTRCGRSLVSSSVSTRSLGIASATTSLSAQERVAGRESRVRHVGARDPADPLTRGV